MGLDFPKIQGHQDLIDTMNKVQTIFSEVHIAWKQCPNVMYSKEDHVNKVTSVLELFADPDTYGLYKIALVALESDWT